MLSDIFYTVGVIVSSFTITCLFFYILIVIKEWIKAVIENYKGT